MVGPRAGRWIDQRGGRVVLPMSNVLFALGLLILAVASGPMSLLIAWVILGVAMGYGLYDAAFAALVFLYGSKSRTAITGITLIAGFASTVGWPMSALMLDTIGWRAAVSVWALLHLSFGLLLNRIIPRKEMLDPLAPGSTLQEPNIENRATSPIQQTAPSITSSTTVELPRHANVLLVFAFAASGFVSSAMSAHLPALLQAAGASLVLAVAAGALIGPAQVGARLFQFGALGRAHPLWSAWIATLTHPIAVMMLFLGGPGWAMMFTVFHGIGNGTLTIARGALPLALFGAMGYGERIGKLLALSRFTQALAPWLFGLAITQWQANAMWIGFAVSLAAFAALLRFRRLVF